MLRKFAVLLLAAVALATYWNALHAPFIWDDDVAIATNQTIHEIGDSLNPPIETPVSGRPVVNLSLAMNYAAGALDPTGYHVVNLAVHVLCALLLFGIVRRTVARQRLFSSETIGDGVALTAALVWMVHPLLSETVDYTTQRSESIMGLFFLLTLYAAIRARRPESRATVSGSKKTLPGSRKTRAGSRKWTAIAVASCALGMAAKESMVIAPLAVVLYDIVFEFDSAAEAFAARKTLYAGLAATWLELGAIMWHWPRSTVGGASIGPVTYALNQAEMIGRYLWLSVWPRALVLDYGLPRLLHIGDVLPLLVLVAVLLAATVVALVRWPAAGFCGALFFLTLAPTSSIVPIVTEVGAERRMYLPLAALVVLAVVSIARAFDRRAGGGSRSWIPAVAAAALVVAGLSARTIYRNRDFASPLELWQTVVDRRPQGRARFAYATQLMEAGRNDEATTQLRLAVVDNPDARAGLGTVLLMQGQFDEGIGVLDAFVRDAPARPNRVPARALLAQAHRAKAEQAMQANHPADAAAEARKSLEYDDTSADAHNVLGAAIASQGDLRGAIAEFQAAVRLNPQHAQARNNLARAMAMSR